MADADGAPKLRRAASSGTFGFQTIFSRDNPGKLEDFYEVAAKQLGEGSFGSVFKATCKETRALRAVKGIEKSKVTNHSRFQREINIMKELDHPNVVRLYETFQDARKIYLVMELCNGGELFDRIIEEAPTGFDELKAATYVRQMIASLCYIHAQKFAHRDVKPENFLLQNTSPDAALKIIDFGLACNFEPGKPMTTKAGTAYYVAPEVLKSDYNEKCDIWSAGVISFILLCGYPPFAGETDPEILKKVKAGKFEFRSPEWDTISQGAKNLITQMLTVDPQLRCSADSLLNNPWLKAKGSPDYQPLKKDFVARLKGFVAAAKLKKVVLAVVAQQIPDDNVESLQDNFRSLDRNGDGKLSIDEIREGMEKEGMNVPPALEELLKSVDINRSGDLDYTEFLAATMERKHYMKKETCWAAFRIFDLDGDGKITKTELEQVLNGPDVKAALGKDKIEAMISEVDINGDGCVDFEEFYAMMVPSPKAKAKGKAKAKSKVATDPEAQATKKRRVSGGS